MVAQILIRPFEPSDRDAVIALYKSTWHATYDAIDGVAAINTVVAALLDGDAPEMFALPPGDVALVATFDGKIAGGARAHPRDDGVHLSGFYVYPGWQHRGVGAALLSALAARFPAHPVWRADVRPTSAAALAFYARHGFVEIGHGYADVGGGHCVDVKQLRCANFAVSTDDRVD